MLRRLAVLLYGSICYIVFLATFLYTVGFIGNILVPRSIDGPRQGNLAAGLAVDIALLLGFAIQHSVTMLVPFTPSGGSGEASRPHIYRSFLDQD